MKQNRSYQEDNSEFAILLDDSVRGYLLGNDLKISKDGKRVFNLTRNFEPQIFIDQFGYPRVRLHSTKKFRENNPDKPLKMIMGIHRLMALAWIGIPPNFEELQINHIDSDRSNNHPSNLEWCTTKENMLHALTQGKRTDNKWVLVKDTKKGEIKEYYSIAECARKMGLQQTMISKFIREDVNILRFNRFLFKLKDNPIPFPCKDYEYQIKNNEKIDIISSEKDMYLIKASSIRGRRKLRLKTFDDAVKRLKTDEETLSKALSSSVPEDKIINGWTVSLVELKTLSGGLIAVVEKRINPITNIYKIKPIRVTNLITGEIKEYSSGKEFADSIKVNKKTMQRTRIRNMNNGNGPRFRHYLIEYYDENGNIEPYPPIVEKPPRDYSDNGLGMEIVVKNIKTGEIKEYKSQNECSRAFNVESANVWHYVKEDDSVNIVRMGRYLFKRKDNPLPFPERAEDMIISASAVDIFDNINDVYKVIGYRTNNSNRRKYIFKTEEDAARELEISVADVNKALDNRSIIRDWILVRPIINILDDGSIMVSSPMKQKSGRI